MKNLNKKVEISKIKNPEGNYRYQIMKLAWEAMMDSKISVEENELYKEWFWELSI